jgi:ribonucleoside-diphosphate reductase alpha chain
LEVNVNLVNELKRRGLWEQLRDELLRSQGDISNMADMPEDMKKVYQTSFNIAPTAFIEIAGRAQKWIDQAISRNMYLASRDVDEMMGTYMSAWEKGLKTTYYLHMKPRHTAEQSTTRVNKTEAIAASGGGARKGFGFAVAVAQTAPVMAGATVGGTAQQVLDRKPVELELPEGMACPIDPAEREQCEGCQ